MRVAVLAMALMWTPARAGVLSNGAEAFEQGDLDGAIAAWEEGLGQGQATGALLYDLGNGWYRKGDLPRAVAHYRSAQRLRPRDGNVHHNLALARSELSGVPAPVPAPSPWMALVSVLELGLLGTLVTGLGSVTAFLWWRRRLRALALASVALVTLGLGLALLAGSGARAPAIGVVVDRPAVVRDAARADGAERFRLVPGTEVQVHRSYASFELVEDGRGRRGWVPARAILTPR